MFSFFKKRDNGDLLSALVAAIGLMAIFTLSNCLFAGAFSLCTGDIEAQYVPFVKAFINKIFSGNNFSYSFSSELGYDVFANYVFFSCFSPFTVLFFIIKDVVVAIDALIILKFSFAAFFFYRFCVKVLKKQGPFAIMFSVAYAIGSFSIVSYINIFFMDALYVLPILAICLYRFVVYGKKIGLILGYAYSFIICFYTGYVLGIFTAILFFLAIIMVCLDENKAFDKKRFCKYVAEYVICVLIAFLVSSFAILPTAIFIFSHSKMDATQLAGMEADILDVLCSFFVGALREDSTFYPFYYCGLSVLYAVPAFFFVKYKDFNKKIKLFVGVVISVLLISSLFSLPYLAWHCMDAPDGLGYRFGYLIAFSVCAISVFVFEKLDFKTSKMIIILCVWNGIYLLSWFLKSNHFKNDIPGYSVKIYLINLLILLFYLILIEIKKKNSSGIIVGIWSIIFFGELVYNGYLINDSYLRNEYSEREVVNLYYEEEYKILNELPADANKYRVYQKNIFPNTFQQFNVKGIGVSFSSFENYNVRNMLDHMGFMTSLCVLTDYGTTPVMKMLLSEKYDIEMDGESVRQAIKNAAVKENDNILNIGYMVNKNIVNCDFREELVNINPFENQNALISSMIGEEVNIFERLNANVNLYSDGLDLYQEEGYILYLLGDGNSYGILNIITYDDNPYDELIYAYFPQMLSLNMGNIPTVYGVNGDHGTFMFDSKITTPHVIEVGVGDDGICQVDISVNRGMFVEGGRLFDMYFYRMNEEAFNEAYDILSSGQLEVDEFEDGYISGKINVTSNDQLLFFNVPYDKNWSAYVDGTEVEIIPVVNDVFMALDICEGEHEIVLKYKNPYISYGMILSMLGILFTVIIAYKEKKKVN